MKLVILGNGFDLHHGLKTSFSDFREYLLSSDSEDNRVLVRKIDILLAGYVLDAHTKPWNEIENAIGKMFYGNSELRLEDESVQEILEVFTDKFTEYIKLISTNLNLSKNELIAKELADASIILTFNYTTLYNAYDLNQTTDVFHIHGNANEDFHPIIGHFYRECTDTKNSTDYEVRFSRFVIHKHALALKQSEVDLAVLIEFFCKKWQNSITDVVVIGYSFGESDEHIYPILNEILVEQVKQANVPNSAAKNIPKINFKFFDYNSDETAATIFRIQNKLAALHRRISVKITGVGHINGNRELLRFEKQPFLNPIQETA